MEELVCLIVDFLSLICLPQVHNPCIRPLVGTVFHSNGEIYNFADLRKELEVSGERFIGRTDTEVILAVCERWGIVDALPRLAGMFAFAIWDSQESILYLVRDRIGIKPLYYTNHQGNFTFASELRPLVKWMGSLPTISRRGLTECLRLGYVP